jgi:AbrB family looped-hinge helix DNA binding protein
MGKALDVRVAQNGRMVLPKAARDALGLTDGGTIVVSVEGNEVKLTSIHQSVKLAQQIFSQHVQGISLLMIFSSNEVRKQAQKRLAANVPVVSDALAKP